MLVVDLERFDFFALVGFAADGRAAGSRTVGARTGEVSIREAIARFDGAALLPCPGLPRVWLSESAALRSRSMAAAAPARTRPVAFRLTLPSSAACAARTWETAGATSPPVVRERKAPIGIRAQRDRSERAETGCEVLRPIARGVAAASASVSDDESTSIAMADSSSSSASNDSCRTDSKSNSKTTLARTGEPTLLP